MFTLHVTRSSCTNVSVVAAVRILKYSNSPPLSLHMLWASDRTDVMLNVPTVWSWLSQIQCAIRVRPVLMPSSNVLKPFDCSSLILIIECAPM